MCDLLLLNCFHYAECELFSEKSKNFSSFYAMNCVEELT